MSINRRQFVRYGGLAAGATWLARTDPALAQAEAAARGEVPPGTAPGARDGASPATPARTRGGTPYLPVVTPNGSTLPWRVVGGVKVGHLVAEVVDHEFAPGMRAECWGYNGSTPGPTIEAVEGDRLRIYVTNRLPEATSVHWHGVIVPNGMDGVAGLNQPAIEPGQTFVYEFVVKHPGTFMYHPHFDEMTQMGMGMTGMLVVHPRRPRGPRVDRDFALLTHEWRLDAGARRPDPNEMTDFNVLTFNSKAFPGTAPLVVGRGERVRIRLGNLSAMDHHPIHLHGIRFKITATDGGDVPEPAQVPETTVLVPVGSTRVIEFVAEEAGDWAMHCHMTHHVMMQMGHGLPPLIGADMSRADRRISRLLPGYMSMGTRGMGRMGEMQMPIPDNSLPMRGGSGPFGYIDMGGMFTIVKVRENPEAADPAGWYTHPAGSVAAVADPARMRADGISISESSPAGAKPSG